MNGYGTETMPNGDTYQGFFHNDERHGQGEYFKKENGWTYVGPFVNGKKNGKFKVLTDESESECINYVSDYRKY